MAEQLYLQSLEARQRSTGKNHPEYTQVLSNLAILYAAMDRTAQALERMDEAATIEDGLIGQIFVLGSERQRMNYLNAFQMDYYAYISLVLNYASNDPSAKRAVFELVLRRKAIGLEALAAQQDAVLGGRYPHLSSKLHALTMLRRQIAQKTLEGPGSGGAEAHQALLAEWDTQREGLEEELARQIPEMNLEQKLRATDLQTVAKSIPSGAALVEFVRFDDINFTAVFSKGGSLRRPSRYLAFVLSGDERENIQMFDLGEAEPIEQRIAKFRKSIAGGDRHLLLAEQGTRHLLPGNQRTRRVVQAEDGAILRAAVFDPLLPALGDIKRVFLAPDGDLTRLPFEVLPVDGGQCLIDAYQFMYLSTGRDLLSLDMASPHEPDSAIVAAAPDFDLGHKEADMSSEELGHPGRQSRDLDQESALFLPLPGTRLEGEQISGLLDVHPLLGVDVLESRLKASRSPRILHIATHGFFLEDQERDRDQDFGTRGADDRLGHLSRLENPLLRSGLALAGANTWLAKRALVAEAEDGIMTAEDVSGLDLLATELVVLSACETGLGEVQVGEGVFGLRRAFVLAGAKTLVMSLWKVPDQQTQELMVDFYQRILQGQPRAKALREAQLAMKAKHPDPLYWGAFICQGDPSPLPQSG